MIPIFVGFDQREAVAYHAFCQSVIDHTSVPVQFIPLVGLGGFDGQRDGSNAFIYSRFLVPHLNDFWGFAIYADGDMICKADIAELWKLRDPYKSVQVVQHDYKTRFPKKYLGSKNEDYPRKNWSSLILWNCGDFKNRILTPAQVSKMSGSELHRFGWIPEERIGQLPKEWNWIVGEYPENPDAKLLHYSIGTPCFQEYSTGHEALEWHQTYQRLTEPKR